MLVVKLPNAAQPAITSPVSTLDQFMSICGWSSALYSLTKRTVFVKKNA